MNSPAQPQGSGEVHALLLPMMLYCNKTKMLSPLCSQFQRSNIPCSFHHPYSQKIFGWKSWKKTSLCRLTFTDNWGKTLWQLMSNFRRLFVSHNLHFNEQAYLSYLKSSLPRSLNIGFTIINRIRDYKSNYKIDEDSFEHFAVTHSVHGTARHSTQPEFNAERLTETAIRCGLRRALANVLLRLLYLSKH